MTAPAMEGARWLSVAETAETLGVKPRRIYELIERRAVPHLRVGRIIRLDLAQVVEALQVEPVLRR